MMTMEKSKYYYKVLDYYEQGFWSIKKVRNAVKCGWITPEEFEEITGEQYE